jgi:hypothetical protein
MATLKGGLAHDVSILLGIGRHLGSQPPLTRSGNHTLGGQALAIVE